MRLEMDTREFRHMAKENSGEFARRWFAASQERLEEADSQDSSSNLFPIMRSGIPPRWDESRGNNGAWVFEYTHHATVYHEYGTTEHEVEAKNAQFLKFEWPDAPPAIREMFSETFPTVFFKKVEVSGVDAIRFIRGGKEDARKVLEPA